ncbi:MAG: RibD family protein [Bacteroidales bacterium]|nr:RibD family protein [Bacteroidales bacterium]
MNKEHTIEKLLPKIILHNTISLDGSLRGFEADLNMHYSIASSLQVDAYLVGSQTILDASDEIPPEPETEEEERIHDTEDVRPFWIVVDSGSRLKGILHFYRQMEYIKDIIVLVSKSTPKDYLHYLKEKKYPYVKAGKGKVDFFEAFRILKEKYRIETILTDTGPTLNNFLLQQNLADEISVIVAPFIVAKSQPKIFIGLDIEEEQIKLSSRDAQKLGNDYVWLRYKLRK